MSPSARFTVNAAATPVLGIILTPEYLRVRNRNSSSLDLLLQPSVLALNPPFPCLTKVVVELFTLKSSPKRSAQ